MNLLSIISEELSINIKSVEKVLSLLSDGATIPFIARYRKEATGNLDEVKLIEIKDRNNYWLEFLKRKFTILQSIDNQGKLTAELKSKIEHIRTIADLEDLYLPYKPKRTSKGQKAIEKGLKPLAIYIQKEANSYNIEQRAEHFINKKVASKKEALEGAVHILSEWIAEDKYIRDKLRGEFKRYSEVICKVKRGKKEEGEKYKDYFNFTERTSRIASHRILALLRAEKEGILSFKIDIEENKSYDIIERSVFRKYAENNYIDQAITDGYKRILQPNFESEIKKSLKEKADKESITVFAENLKQLLLQSPLGAKNILAIDPGFRSGCKIAILNKNGTFIENKSIFPHPPQLRTNEAIKIISDLVIKHKIEAIAIGDGTAGMETEKLCREIFKKNEIMIFAVNEAGASVYSASELAREEFGNLDLTVRGAISIGRRLIDPLAELVKIDAKSIGVGQYQHDVNQPLLKQKLTEVVEHCVNHVGVELNTASYPILSYVSGLGMTTARNIVKYRNDNGNFKERKELLKVTKMGKKSYEQAAGFLRIKGGKNPLDNTIIHPESYIIVKELLNLNQTSIEDILSKKAIISKDSIQKVKQRYDHYTVASIIQELQKPTQDPRSVLKEMKSNNIQSISDIFEGMILNGKVNNITNFGAFVDIGIKESGLVHISEISNTFITNIQDSIKLNQQVTVKVLEVDVSRKRIQLSIKQV